tara:strand:- start:1637 stop:1942 length:306 start_codon:yes stop_codon:yes gene_type:complete
MQQRTFADQTTSDTVSSLATTACFAVRANAEPGVVPRVLELFAKRNLVPTRLYAVQEGSDSVVIDIQMANMLQPEREYLAACMRQIYDVSTVLTSEKAAVI